LKSDNKEKSFDPFNPEPDPYFDWLCTMNLGRISKIENGLNNKGRIKFNHTEEAKLKISQAGKGNKHMKGKSHTDEAKSKLSEASKNRVVSDETKNKISNSNKGKLLTDETKSKISAAKKGKKPSCYIKEYAIYNEVSYDANQLCEILKISRTHLNRIKFGQKPNIFNLIFL